MFAAPLDIEVFKGTPTVDGVKDELYNYTPTYSIENYTESSKGVTKGTLNALIIRWKEASRFSLATPSSICLIPSSTPPYLWEQTSCSKVQYSKTSSQSCLPNLDNSGRQFADIGNFVSCEHAILHCSCFSI